MWAVVAIAMLGLVLRLAFDLRAPPFVTNDSLSYLLPGYDLLHGGSFMPLLKRPPLYSLFVGGVFGLLGEELRALTLVQHLLGVLTVLATYGVGRLLFGPGGGVAGGGGHCSERSVDRHRALPDERDAVRRTPDGRAAGIPAWRAGRRWRGLRWQDCCLGWQRLPVRWRNWWL